MDVWGRYDSSSSSSDDDDIYFGDFRKSQRKKFDTTVVYNPNRTKNHGQLQHTQVPYHAKGQPAQPNDSFSSTSSESPTYELERQFSGSDSSLNDSNSPIDLSTPKGWKQKDNENIYQNVSRKKTKDTILTHEQLKWPNQTAIIRCTNTHYRPTIENNNNNKHLTKCEIGGKSTSSFSSVKGEIGESPDIAALDTPSSCDDNSPTYQNSMKGKRLFDVRQKNQFSEINDSIDRSLQPSFPSLASLNAYGFQGHEGLASYTSLPYTSYLDESVTKYNKKSMHHLPSTSSMMSNFNETLINEREDMASLSNLSSLSCLSSAHVAKKSTLLKDELNSDSSPVSIISNFTESVGEAREGLASYNSFSSLYKSSSDSNYADMSVQSRHLSSDYVQMSGHCGEALASYTSSPQTKSGSSSEEPSLCLNSTIQAAPQSEYVDMNQVNVDACVPRSVNFDDAYAIIPQKSSLACKVATNVQIGSKSILKDQFFTSDDLSGDYVELSKCQAYMAALKDHEKNKQLRSVYSSMTHPPPLPAKKSPCIKKPLDRCDSRTISPSPVVSLKHSEMESNVPICETRTKFVCDNKSSVSLMSFPGDSSSLMASRNDLTIGESLCQNREALASYQSYLPDFDADVFSFDISQNLNDVSKISQPRDFSSQGNTRNIIQNITESCPPEKNLVVDTNLVFVKKGTFSDSGVDCASVSSPVIQTDQVGQTEEHSESSQTSKSLFVSGDQCSSRCSSSSLNSTSSVADSGSQCLSLLSGSTEASSTSNSGKSNATVLIVNLSACDKQKTDECKLVNCDSESEHTTSSVNGSSSQLSASNSMSSIYSTCSNGSSIQSEVTHVKRVVSNSDHSSNTSTSNLTNRHRNYHDGSRHSINSETENASILSLYGNGASTPSRACASATVAFPNDHLLVSPIATYAKIPARTSVGGNRVVTSPCVKPSMLNLKDTKTEGGFLSYKTGNPGSCLSKAKQTLDNSANVNSDNFKSLKDKQILVGSLLISDAITSDGLSSHGIGSRAIPEEEEEEEVQMVYANAFRRIDLGTSNAPSNVVVRSTVKRVPSLTEPNRAIQNPYVGYEETFRHSTSNSTGNLNSQNVCAANARVVSMRTKTATVRNTRPQSALGRIQGDSSTLPRTSRVVRLKTTNDQNTLVDLSPHRGTLPDLVPLNQSEQEVLLPASEVCFKAPLPYRMTKPSSHPVPQEAANTSSNYMPMSTSSARPLPPARVADSVSLSSLFQHASESEENYAMDSSNSSLDCDNFSFDFNQPEDSVTSVMFSSTVDFRQLEESSDNQIYQDIDNEHGLGAHGGQDCSTRFKRHKDKGKYEFDPRVSRQLQSEDKENSPDRIYYPKSPLPVHRPTKEPKSEASSPKKSSRFFTWPHKNDSSPKSKLFSLKKKDKKETSKNKRRKETRYEPVPIFDHDTDWKTKLHTLCNGRRVVRYLNYSESPMIINHYPPPKESTTIKWNRNLVQGGESDDSNEYAVIHPKSILSKKSKEYKYDGDVPSPIIITKTRTLSVSSSRKSSRK